MSVISNTTVLSNFAAIDSFGRLHELYGEVFLSTEVYKEIQHGLEEGYTFYAGIDEILRGSSASSRRGFTPRSERFQAW